MTETVSPSVVLIAKTEFLPPTDVPWSTDAEGGQALAEFAGRACYQSWRKPNPATATVTVCATSSGTPRSSMSTVAMTGPKNRMGQIA